MSLDIRKKTLVEEFNQNNRTLIGLKQQMDRFQTRQVQIQGQLQLIEQLEKEQKEEKQKVKKGKKQ